MTITVRWAGPSDAGVESTYKIERSLDGSAWTTLAASQAATSPYISPSSTLSGDTDYGSTTVKLTSGTSFAINGFCWIDDALVEWKSKSSDQLNGCIWHSGYGIYAAATAVVEAHESYVDSVSITNNAAIYRITHTAVGKSGAAPLFIWYYDPATPINSHHCVVVVHIGTDVGGALRAGESVKCYLERDDEFNNITGEHLDSNEDAANIGATNALGLVFFHCVKNNMRITSDGTPVGRYVFVLDSDDTQSKTVYADVIPDRDWILLSQIVTE